MVSGTDEPFSVRSDEPHFSMQFDINLNGYNIYLENRCLNTLELKAIGICIGSDIRSLCRTNYAVMTKGIQIMMCLDFLCYLCLGRDHGPMDPNGWLKRPVPWGPMNHHGCC